MNEVCVIKEVRFGRPPYPWHGEIAYGWIYDVDVVWRCRHVGELSLFFKVSSIGSKYEEEPKCCESALWVADALSEYLCSKCVIEYPLYRSSK